MLRSVLIILFFVTFSIIVSPAVAQDSGGYDITIENREINIPEQTRTVNGEEFTATSIGFVEPGTQITAQVNPSTNDPYDILLYDRDKERVDAQFSATGETTAAFDTDDLNPGTYVVTVRTDQTEAVQPVIIQAYETRVSLPANIEEGGSIIADISINEYSIVAAPDIGKVELVIVDTTTGTVVKRSSADKIDQFEYMANTTVDYESGEYQIYTSVYNNTGAEEDELDLLSVSDRHTLMIGDQSDENNSAGNPEDGETSKSQDSEDHEGENETSDSSSTNNTDTSSGDENTSTTELKETNSSGGSENAAEDPTGESTSGDRVIEPNEPTTSSGTSSEAVPLEGIQILAILLLSAAVGVRIRSRD